MSVGTSSFFLKLKDPLKSTNLHKLVVDKEDKSSYNSVTILMVSLIED